MKKLTVLELRDYLMALTGKLTLRVTYGSEGRMRKKLDELPCPWQRLTKEAVYVGGIGISHHEAAQAEAETRSPGIELPGAEGRKWGNRIGESCLIDKDGVLFLELVNVNEIETRWFLDGVRSPRGVVEPWLYTHREIISTRTFELSKIIMITVIRGLDGEDIEVIH